MRQRDIDKKQGYCCKWHEGIAKRGADNIASYVWRYTESKAIDGQCKEFVFFSDNNVQARIRILE